MWTSSLRGGALLTVTATVVLALVGAPTIADGDNLRGSADGRAKGGNVADGLWTGTAVDDKYGVTGSVRFTIRKDGRLLRHFRMTDMAGDCPGAEPVVNVQLPRAKIRPSGLMRGHYVAGEPGSIRNELVSYSARFDRREVTGGRIYNDRNLDGPPGQCEVQAATFSATRGGG